MTSPEVGLSSRWVMWIMSRGQRARIRENKFRCGLRPPCTTKPWGLLTMVRCQLSRRVILSRMPLASSKGTVRQSSAAGAFANTSLRNGDIISLSPSWNRQLLSLSISPVGLSTRMSFLRRCFCPATQPTGDFLRYRSRRSPLSQDSMGKMSILLVETHSRGPSAFIRLRQWIGFVNGLIIDLVLWVPSIITKCHTVLQCPKPQTKSHYINIQRPMSQPNSNPIRDLVKQAKSVPSTVYFLFVLNLTMLIGFVFQDLTVLYLFGLLVFVIGVTAVLGSATGLYAVPTFLFGQEAEARLKELGEAVSGQLKSLEASQASSATINTVIGALLFVYFSSALNPTLEIFVVANFLYAWVFLPSHAQKLWEPASKFLSQWVAKIKYQA